MLQASASSHQSHESLRVLPMHLHNMKEAILVVHRRRLEPDLIKRMMKPLTFPHLLNCDGNAQLQRTDLISAGTKSPATRFGAVTQRLSIQGLYRKQSVAANQVMKAE